MSDIYSSNSPDMAVFVDETIKICKTEEAKLAETTVQCKDILRSMKTLVNGDSYIDDSGSGDVKYDYDVSLEERKEIELLEQVLKKALKVRNSSAGTTHLGADLQEKKTSKISYTSHSNVPNKNTVKDADKIKTQKLSSVEVQGRCHQRGGSLKGIAVCGPVHAKPFLVKRGPSPQPTIRRKLLITKPVSAQILEDPKKSCQPAMHFKGPYRKRTVGPPSEDNDLTKEVKTNSQVSPLKEQWVPSPLLPVWRAQRAKKNSLWNKLLSQHSKLVPERAYFKDRLISTFLMEWPANQAADNLMQLGLDVTHCYHAELQNRQHLSACVSGKDPVCTETSTERVYESLLMLEGFERMMAKVIKHADLVKKDWERKPGGPLFPLRKRGEWGDMLPCLPQMVFYSTEAELKELDSLKFRVDQLHLEIHMHQAMSETLTHSLTPQQASSECPSATALRGLYSFLGEGGARFPALVLDSEPDHT